MRDWDDHRLILALHRHGTLRATGDALGVTHTTIARRLAALNVSEPAPLFARQGRAYRTTEYGLERVAIAENIETLDFAATRLQKRADGDLSGPLSLSIPQAVMRYLLMGAIEQFTQTHPNVDLMVVGTDRLADLDRGEADVVIRGHGSPPDHLVGRQICTVGISYYAHREYLERTDPKSRQWLVASTPCAWIADSPLPDCPAGLVIHDIESRFLALEHGLGLSRAACFMADPHPDLIRLDKMPSLPLYGLWVLTHPDLKRSPKVKALMQIMTQSLVDQREVIIG